MWHVGVENQRLKMIPFGGIFGVRFWASVADIEDAPLGVNTGKG